MPRVLSEQEYNAIQQQVLASMPKGLDEQNFRHMFPSMMDGAVATAENSPAPMVGSALGRFVSGLGQSLNPMGLVESIVNPYDPKRALAQGMAISDQIDKAKAARTTSERLGHYAAVAVPPIGIPAATAGEAIGSGDIAGGMGQATGLIAPMVVPELLSRAAASQPAQDLGEHITQVGKGLAKKVGIDPQGMELQSSRNDLQATRMRLQAARSASRQTKLRGEIANLSPKPKTTLPEGVEPYAPNVSSGEAPTYTAPANLPNRPWGSGVPSPVLEVDRYLPNVSGVNAAGRTIEPTPTDVRTVIPDAPEQVQAIQDAVEAVKRRARPGTQATPQELDAARKATATTSAPPETSPASEPPPPARARGAAAPTRQQGRALAILQQDGGLSPAEAQQALSWMQQGVDLETVQKRIELARQLQSSGSFAGLPGPDEAAAQAQARAAESRARSTRRGTSSEEE